MMGRRTKNKGDQNSHYTTLVLPVTTCWAIWCCYTWSLGHSIKNSQITLGIMLQSVKLAVQRSGSSNTSTIARLKRSLMGGAVQNWGMLRGSRTQTREVHHWS